MGLGELHLTWNIICTDTIVWGKQQCGGDLSYPAQHPSSASALVSDPDMIWESKVPSERTPYPSLSSARCGHVTKFQTTRHQQSVGRDAQESSKSVKHDFSFHLLTCKVVTIAAELVAILDLRGLRK